ncbi:MAG: FAD-dependent thymidylate synthase [Candidatus Margulisiibacteriota bacterium]
MEQKIILAGYNIDTDVIEELKISSPERQDITPETLSAAYARISRDPRPIDELRKASRQEVEKSRKSNSSIIFKMGHHSVAEHAVFNFDIIGISRLAVESIEHFRLCSFTEKSQRYITLENDFVIPKEIKDAGFEKEFTSLVKTQNELYHKLNEKLSVHVFEKHKGLAADPKNKSLLEGWAKEDARYVTSLATQAQLGLTVNARNLELMFRRFASQKNNEVKEFSKKMFALVQKIAPSIILFTEANDFDAKTYEGIRAEVLKPEVLKKKPDIQSDVSLVGYTPDADDVLVTSLMFAVSDMAFENCLASTKKMSAEEKKDIVKASCANLKLYDSVLREYENIDLTFDVVLSSSCFAQLKRHRMATIIAQPYDPSLGVTMPPAIGEIGMKSDFDKVIAATDSLYEKIAKKDKDAAAYVLTNAHRRRVIFKCNARELYHVSRLREDEHAQWDIQNISTAMSSEAKKVMPLTMMFIGGKDAYPRIYKEIFYSPPSPLS